MPYFALTDSDWPWDDMNEGRPLIVEADTPEEAVKKATELQILSESEDEKIDRSAISGGVQWKVAQLWNVGLQGICWEEGKVYDEETFSYYPPGCNGKLFNSEGSKSDVRTLELDDAEAEALRDA